MVNVDLRKILAELNSSNVALQKEITELSAKVQRSKLRVAELEKGIPRLHELRRVNEELGRRVKEQHETIVSVREQLLADQDSGPLYCAIFDFVPNEEGELPLSVADAVSLEEEFSDGWGYVSWVGATLSWPTS